MKRRLDLALALIHHPRILFLDEPTTGLDVQSRAALWDEVARLARNDGVTVFLTTQYLEEADSLADRRRDHRPRADRRRGHARRAQGRDRPSDGRGGSRPTTTRSSASRRCSRASGPPLPATRGAAAVRLADGTEELADVVRGLDDEGVKVADLSSTPPAWTTSSWPRPAGRWREPATDDGAEEDTGEHRATTVAA